MSTLQTYNLKHPDASGNQITFTSAGDVNFDNGAVYLDSTNNRLGIGIIPQNELHVNSTDSATRVQITNSTTGYALGDGTALIQSGNDFYVNNRESGRLFLATSNATALSISSSGAIGVGTATPAATVHVENDDPQFRLQRTGSHSTSAGPLIQFQGKGPNETNYNFAKIQAVSSGSNNAGELLFFTNSAGSQEEHIRLDSSGRILKGVGSVTVEHTDIEGEFNKNGAAGKYFAFGRTNRHNNGTNKLLTFHHGYWGGSREVAAIGVETTSSTAGSGYGHGNIVFYTGNSGNGDSGSTSAERMRVTSSGVLQMGDPSVNGGWQLFVADEGTASQRGRTFFRAKSGTSGVQEILQIFNGTTAKLLMRADGNIYNASGGIGTLSDAKLKENIVDANSQWDDIKSLRIRKYNFKEETGHDTHTQIGLVAQEVEKISPGLVWNQPDKDENDNDVGTTTKIVNTSVFYMKAIKALQEAMDRIETLEQRLSDAGIA